MTSKLQAIKETVEILDREATRGPWKSEHYDTNFSTSAHSCVESEECIVCEEVSPGDADFIAFARIALPDLLRIAEDLQARLKVAEDALKLIVIDSERIGGFVALEKINDNATAALAEIRKDLNVSPAGVTKDEVL